MKEQPIFMLEAACRGSDVELMFPDERSESGIAAAKAICAQCAVIEPCLEYALKNKESWGVYGGHTEKERASLLRGISRAARRQRRANGN